MAVHAIRVSQAAFAREKSFRLGKMTWTDATDAMAPTVPAYMCSIDEAALIVIGTPVAKTQSH